MAPRGDRTKRILRHECTSLTAYTEIEASDVWAFSRAQELKARRYCARVQLHALAMQLAVRFSVIAFSLWESGGTMSGCLQCWYT